MTQESKSGEAVAERVRAANISVNGSSSVEAMLANSLRERKPLADDGRLHETVQAAQDVASSFVFVPPGTFNESVTIDTDGLTLLGSGRATLIEGGDSTSIIVTADNVKVSEISARSTPGTGTNSRSVDIRTGKECIIKQVLSKNSDQIGFRSDAARNKFINCGVEAANNSGIQINNGVNSSVVGCTIAGTSSDGIKVKEDGCIVSNNVLKDSGRHGISVPGFNDNIIGGNRIINSNNYGIFINGADNIVHNNRVSDSGSVNIDDSGSGTVLDGNLTGASN